MATTRPNQSLPNFSTLQGQASGARNGFERLPKNTKIAVVVLGALVTTALYYALIHSSLSDELNAEEQRAAKLQSDLNAAEQRQQEFLRLKATLAAREALDRRHLKVLPERPEIPAFLQDLNRLAELSGLEIQLVEPRPEETDNLAIRIPVTLSLSGRYHHVAKFFYNASRLERAVNMENIRLTNPKIKDDQIVLKIDVLATTFRRPSDAAPSKRKAGGSR